MNLFRISCFGFRISLPGFFPGLREAIWQELATNTKVDHSSEKTTVSNATVAEALETVADLLEAQGANPFRVRAYRSGARTVRELKGNLADMLRAEGIAALIRLPTIGKSLAHAIEHLVKTGRFPLLERLRGEEAAERIFATIPSIGPETARRIHDTLGIETLAELEMAAYDGRLASVPGLGRKRIRAVLESLAGRRQRSKPVLPVTPAPEPAAETVPIEELLSIDDEYREAAAKGHLPRIAPRRFNPTHEAWLPILHTHRGDRHYTALFSNTARAHELGTTHDWVVIYRDDHQSHDRWTVITSGFGRLRGRRVVRGREPECLEYYRHHQQLALFDVDDFDSDDEGTG